MSGTDDAVEFTAGRNTELAYQVAKAAKELKRDMENALLANVAAAAGDFTFTNKILGGLPTWIQLMYLLELAVQELVAELLEQMELKGRSQKLY